MILNCRPSLTPYAAVMAVVSFLILICASLAGAQTSRIGATLEGIVSDSSGAVIPGAEVTLRNTLTNQSRTATTDDRGFFRTSQLAVGTYEVALNHPGFAPYRHTGLIVNLGQTSHLDIVLAPASASTQVTVSAQPSALDASQTSVVSLVDQERILLIVAALACYVPARRAARVDPIVALRFD